MGNVLAKIEFETALFNDRVNKIFLLSKKTMPEVVKSATITFLESAGAATKVGKKKREIFDVPSGFVVPFKRNVKTDNGKRKVNSGAWFFKRRSEAVERSKITYWGLTKAGWLGNKMKLGKPFNMSNKKNISQMLDEINMVKNMGTEIEVRNRVIGVSSYAWKTKKEGLFNANKRLAGQLADLERKFAKSF